MVKTILIIQARARLNIEQTQGIVISVISYQLSVISKKMINSPKVQDYSS
ncbi:MAG: hypothetical protein F6K17_02545 [Okeania sp. SIO3C4]|nr:hypothetical protein [Okeania sp. SIO3B3]NER01587.1 hypothetical protein [Okeania sp. SIO3C4]